MISISRQEPAWFNLFVSLNKRENVSAPNKQSFNWHLRVEEMDDGESKSQSVDSIIASHVAICMLSSSQLLTSKPSDSDFLARKRDQRSERGKNVFHSPHFHFPPTFPFATCWLGIKGESHFTHLPSVSLLNEPSLPAVSWRLEKLDLFGAEFYGISQLHSGNVEISDRSNESKVKFQLPSLVTSYSLYLKCQRRSRSKSETRSIQARGCSMLNTESENEKKNYHVNANRAANLKLN